MNLGYRLKKRRNELGLTLEYVGNKVGVGKSTVRKWETGDIANMGRDKISLLADALNVSPLYIMGLDPVDIFDEPQVTIQVLGRVAAGAPIEAIEEVIGQIEIPESLARTGDFFGLRIAGDSMEPKISNGDTVLIRKQPDVDSGQIAVVMVNGDDATCKKIVKHENGISLVALNPTYDPKFYTGEEVESIPITIIGRVIELRRTF